MCPVCREPMVVFELDGVEVDRCTSCGGTWLDTGELELITERAGVAADRLAEALAAAGDLRRTGRRCPRCLRWMREFALGGDPVVHLDRCPRGHGLWCDRGEMAAVIREFAGRREAVVARFFAELYQDDLGPMKKGD